MNQREELGYSKHPLPADGLAKPKKPPTEPPKQHISQEKRHEIRMWAEGKAVDIAHAKGMTRGTDYEQMRRYDTFISNETLHWERQAYLKIHQREQGSKNDS